MKPDDSLLDAAARVLTHNSSASLGEVAHQVGVSRATLHRRYGNREALLWAIGERAAEIANEHLAALQLPEDASAAAFDSALDQLINGLMPAIDLYGFVLHDSATWASPELRAAGERFDEQARRFFEHGQRLGRMRTDLPPYWLWYSLWGLLDSASQGVREGYLGHRDVVRLVSATFRHGSEPPQPKP